MMADEKALYEAGQALLRCGMVFESSYFLWLCECMAFGKTVIVITKAGATHVFVK